MYHGRSGQRSSPWSYLKSPRCKNGAKLAVVGGPGSTIIRPEGLESRDSAGMHGQVQETNAGCLANTSLAVCANYSSTSSELSDILHVQSAQQTSEQSDTLESWSVESHVDCTLSLATPKYGRPELHSASFKCLHVVEDSDLERLGSGEREDLQQTSIDDGIIHKIVGFSFNALDEGKGGTRSSTRRDLVVQCPVDILGDCARCGGPDLRSCPASWSTADCSINVFQQSKQLLPCIVDSKTPTRAKVTLKPNKSVSSERCLSNRPGLSQKSRGLRYTQDPPVQSPHPVSSSKLKKSWVAPPLLQGLNDGKSEGRMLLTKKGPLPDTQIVPSRGASRNQDRHEIQALRSCMHCGTSRTPLWRNGPQGPKSLCNACGIRFKKTGRRVSSSKNSDVLSSPSLSVEVVCVSGKLSKRKSAIGPEQAWPSYPTAKKNMQSLGAYSQKRSRSAVARGHGRCSCNELDHAAGDCGNCMADTQAQEEPPIFTLPKCSVPGSECVRSLVEFVTAGTDWKIQDCGNEKRRQNVNSMGHLQEALTDDEEGAFLLMALSCGFVDIRPQTALVPFNSRHGRLEECSEQAGPPGGHTENLCFRFRSDWNLT